MKKYSKFFAIALLVITTMFGTLTSCEKTEQLTEPIDLPTHDVEKELDSLIALSRTNEGRTKFNVMSATSSSQIPSGLYMMNVGYRNYYQHLTQRTGECSWTSYALAANMVADYMGRNYPLNYNRIDAIKNGSNSNYMNIIASYAITNESQYVTTRYDGFSGASGSSTARFNAIKYMLNMLDDGMYTGNPFVAIVGVSGSNKDFHGNDLDPTNISGKKYWINSNSTTQHFVVVSAIQWQSGGVGSVVYYYDPIASTGTLRSCSLTRFLDAMLSGSINYNFMSVKP